MKLKPFSFLTFTLVMSLFTGCNCLKTNCLDPIAAYENSGHNITVGQAESLYDNYNGTFKEKIKDIQLERVPRTNDQYNPTEYVLVNIETLRCYLDMLEKVEKMNEGEDKNNKITGIAIFIGARDTDARLENKTGFFNEKVRQENKSETNNEIITSDRDIRGRLTMFMAPTYRENSLNDVSEAAKHIPFYIEPTNENDKYIGKYKRLFPNFAPRNFAMKRASSSTNRKTTLILEEFNDMPPK